MATYCTEKFENDAGDEKIVFWLQNKHVHDAGFITTIKRALERTYGGTWDVRIGSYQSGQSAKATTCDKCIDFNDLD